MPVEGSLYDYYIDWKINRLKSYDESMLEFKFDRQISFYDMNVPTLETIQLESIIKKLAINGNHILLTGNSGSGKTNLINKFLKNLDIEKFDSKKMNFSS